MVDLRVLVTGAAGFIGSHLVDELMDAGHVVAGIDAAHGDLCKAGTLESAGLDDIGTVIHLAAKPGRLFCEEAPLNTVIDNAAMTTLVARACGERGIHLVYASTSEVYGDSGGERAHEHIPGPLPNNLYGLTKRWGEEVCKLYVDKLTILRISMPYGPGLQPGYGRAAIVNFLDWAQKREPITVHRGSERSWCWIGDTVRAIRMAIEHEGTWNIGRDDDARSMREVAELACRLTGAPQSLITEVDPPERLTVVKRLAMDKLKGLGWTPEVELEQGMERTLSWLRG